MFLGDEGEYQWTLYGLAADFPFRLTADDGDGCTYVLAVRAEDGTGARHSQEAAWLAA
ncbi:hypothetical protein [Streptomyces chattanoogensis]|uniref:hypothetical protein n=1 Tax=Streptomyces chattanoogensis TaxID=66876 RepID=UPI000AB3D5B0|nr:hypothetical protein [Streptomyces chattanoogensis]